MTQPFGAACLAVVLWQGATALAISNGDFATGDLTSWTSSAFDGADAPVAPLTTVVSSGGQFAVEMTTGPFDDDIFIHTLEQTFFLDPLTPILSFDANLPTLTADQTGAGSSLFFDVMFVSVSDGMDFFDLLALDDLGALADPIGTAPGSVTVGAASNPSFDFGLEANLASLAGGQITLFIDLIAEDDGSVFTTQLTNFELGGRDAPIIPEPVSAGLTLAGLGAIAVLRRRG